MLTVHEALALVAEHLGDTSRARHSVFVGYAMRRLGGHFAEDATANWEATGLVHDIDYEATTRDRTRHGLLTAEWLAGRLPEDALTAIAAHDHRTGVVAHSAIAAALKLSDALAIVVATLGPDETAAIVESPDASERLAATLAARPYLAAMLSRLTAELDVPLPFLAEIVRTGPPAA